MRERIDPSHRGRELATSLPSSRRISVDVCVDPGLRRDEGSGVADAVVRLSTSEKQTSEKTVLQSSASALPLMIWLSSSFPVGSFAFSHGIEWAVHDGQVRDAASAIDWIGALLKHGSLRNDAIIASAAWRAVADGDDAALREANDLALALAGSRERFMETTAQGNAFIAAIRASWSNDTVERAAACLITDTAYPVAVAIASAAYGIPRLATLDMFSLALVQNLVSATIRLSVLGHTDGQRVIARLLPVARALAREADAATLDGIGNAAFLSDIAAMKHETQYSRLFRS